MYVLKYRRTVLYILTGYQVLGIVHLDQLSSACHTHISYRDISHLRLRLPKKA